MFKKLVISLLFFSSTVLPNEVIHPPVSLQRILASSVKVSPAKKKNGSGSVISKDGKAFVLTNAHVCLPNSEMLARPELYEKQKDKAFIYKIKSLYRTAHYKIKLSDLKYNSYYDICLIPLPKEHKFMDLPYPQTTPKLSVREKYFFFNLNNKEGILKTKSLFNKDNYFVPSASIAYSTPDKRELSRQRGEYYRLEGKVIAGDSGSLIFNENFELVGQVFGSNYSEKEPQGSVLEKKFIDALLNDKLPPVPSVSSRDLILEEIK